MSAEEKKNLVRRYADDVINHGRLDVIDEICSEDYVSYPPMFPSCDREGDKQLIGMFRSAFPDMRKTIDDLVVEGNSVAERATYTGTHRGELQGIPPTGRQIAFSGMHIFRVADGKIVEARGIMDQITMLQQIGVIPTPEVTQE